MNLPLVAGCCVDFAFLCDSAEAGECGKLRATGIGVDTFEAPVFPATLSLLFVARLSALEGAAALALRVIDADGAVVACLPLRNTAQPPPEGRAAKTPLMARPFVPVERPGDFRLDISVDHRTVHSIPFWVV